MGFCNVIFFYLNVTSPECCKLNADLLELYCLCVCVDWFVCVCLCVYVCVFAWVCSYVCVSLNVIKFARVGEQTRDLFVLF